MAHRLSLKFSKLVARVKEPGILALLIGVCLSSGVQATDAPLNLSDTPLFVSSGNTSLVQLVVQRDNKLFYEAYPTYIDFNGDGVLDIRYKPDEIDYIGYFGSNLCYALTSGTHMSAVSAANDKRCEEHWSGDFLNYLTMTRMDVMLHTLFGGHRSIDTNLETRLLRAFVPWTNHTWGVEYESVAVDGFDISDYSPYEVPSEGLRHHFATNNFELNDVPYLRVRTNQDTRIWSWVDKERVQGDGWSTLDLPLEVSVCNYPLLEEFCQQYPNGQYKPVGLLHEYGDRDSMLFGLLTGSFENNKRGGVLRQPMASFTNNEVDPETGNFSGSSGIVNTLNAIQIPNDFVEQSIQRDCGFQFDRAFLNGECRAWGNPVAEMMYEGMRYLGGEQAPTSEFAVTGGMDATLGLDSPEWDDPFSSDYAHSECSIAYQLVISDPSPSYDGDQLPGSSFGSFTGSGLDGMHVGNIADFISANDASVPGLKFIGESGTLTDMAPSAKTVTSLRNIRGISPEAPHRQGSYYAPSVSYFGHQNDIHPDAAGVQTVSNFTIALGNQLPTIDVNVNGSNISFAPYAKSIAVRNEPLTNYQPTNAIVGFNVEYVTETTGSFRVSFEDNEQGADNDQDALARYYYEVVDGEVIMSVESFDAAGSVTQHMGFTVSGSNTDGIYLLVRDRNTAEHRDNDFFLDVPPGESPGGNWEDGLPLPLLQVRSFAPSPSEGAKQLKSPLWYAAKWGGFKDANNDNIPQISEWDADGDGNPDNYFPIVDPSKIDDALREVFDQINEQSAAGTSVSVSSGSLNSGSRIYQADFVSGLWTGDVESREISTTGEISSVLDWSANDELVDKISTGSRKILTYNPEESTGVAFQWPTNPLAPYNDEISASQANMLSTNPRTGIYDGLGEARVRYLRGESIQNFRQRESALGDIVHSSPQLVGAPANFYPDIWGENEPENDAAYSTFAINNRLRRRVVYVGANDGMLHGFDAGSATDGVYSAGTGEEIFAYVPAEVMQKLPALTHPRYSHRFYVDGTPQIGDAFNGTAWRTVLVGGLRGGGQGFYALDITDPDSIAEIDAEDTVLWEFTDEDDPDMGYSFGSPLIARMNNGKWAAIISNGYGSTENDGAAGSGKSVVFVLDLFTGEVLAKLSNSASLGIHNGMSDPAAVDLDGDYTVDRIYAGDLAGYIHAFDVSSSNTSTWETNASATRAFFSAQDDDGTSQPITSGIALGSHPTQPGLMLYVGTGKYLEAGDQAVSTDEHRIYGLWDKLTGSEFSLTDSTYSLLQQSITAENTNSYDIDGDGNNETTFLTRQSTQHDIDWETDNGWYLDLTYPMANGEQVVANPVLRDGKLFVSTHLPSGNQCDANEGGWLMVLNPVSGAMLEQSPFDLDSDGTFDTETLISGFKNGGNPFAEPTFAAAKKDDIMLTQDSNDPVVTSREVDASINSGTLTWRELEP